jgi:hypothetical protein
MDISFSVNDYAYLKLSQIYNVNYDKTNEACPQGEYIFYQTEKNGEIFVLENNEFSVPKLISWDRFCEVFPLMNKDNLPALFSVDEACSIVKDFFNKDEHCFVKRVEDAVVEDDTLNVLKHMLLEVKFPDDLKFIVGNAFCNCVNLNKVVLPDFLTDIEELAFANCVNLQRISFPLTLQHIFMGAFTNCESLKNAIFSKSVSYIGNSAFAGCHLLDTVYLPDGLTELSANVFSGCSCLKHVYIPDSVVMIENEAFAGCEHLRTVDVSGNTAINESAFKDCDDVEIMIRNNAVSEQSVPLMRRRSR